MLECFPGGFFSWGTTNWSSTHGWPLEPMPVTRPFTCQPGGCATFPPSRQNAEGLVVEVPWDSNKMAYKKCAKVNFVCHFTLGRIEKKSWKTTLGSVGLRFSKRHIWKTIITHPPIQILSPPCRNHSQDLDTWFITTMVIVSVSSPIRKFGCSTSKWPNFHGLIKLSVGPKRPSSNK